MTGGKWREVDLAEETVCMMAEDIDDLRMDYAIGLAAPDDPPADPRPLMERIRERMIADSGDKVGMDMALSDRQIADLEEDLK